MCIDILYPLLTGAQTKNIISYKMTTRSLLNYISSLILSQGSIGGCGMELKTHGHHRKASSWRTSFQSLAQSTAACLLLKQRVPQPTARAVTGSPRVCVIKKTHSDVVSECLSWFQIRMSIYGIMQTFWQVSQDSLGTTHAIPPRTCSFSTVYFISFVFVCFCNSPSLEFYCYIFIIKSR